MPDEQSRALEYRRMMTARATSKVARERNLAGNTSEANRVLTNWNPLLRSEGWDPPYTPDDEK